MRLKKDNLNSPGSMNPREFGTGFSSPRHTSKLISTKRGKSGAPQRVIIGRASNLSFVCVAAGQTENKVLQKCFPRLREFAPRQSAESRNLVHIFCDAL